MPTSARIPPYPMVIQSTTSSSSSSQQRRDPRQRSAPPRQVYAASGSSPNKQRQKQQQDKTLQPSRSSSASHNSGPVNKQRRSFSLKRSSSFDRSKSTRGSRGKRHSDSNSPPEGGKQRSHSASKVRPPRLIHNSSAVSHVSSLDPYCHHGSALASINSSDNFSQDQASSSFSEEMSTQSAPTPQKLMIEYTAERREPSPVSFSSLKRELSRESGEERFKEYEKQYIRTTKRIVDELNRAQGNARRVAAVTSACEAFDHNDELRHNIELSNGTVQALAKMLEHSRTTDDELRMICSALEMVFRGSPKAVQDAFKKTNPSFLSRLLRVLDRCEQRRIKHADISILNISKMIFYFSKCHDLRVQVCRHSDFPDFLARVATSVLNQDCRALRLKILANLAAAEKNKIMLYENVAIVDGILRIAHADSFDLARQNAALALQELANCSHNHVSMANNDQLLGILVKMALVEKSLISRDAVVSALQMLAYNKKNRVRLVQYKDGVVLEALMRTLSVDPDEKIRRRAAGTLTNLACEDTAEEMGCHKGLLEALAVICTKDLNADVQTRAALALTKVGSNINHGMDCFTTLLDALVVASLSKTSNSVTAVLRLKAREVQNREAMAQHAGVLDTLADICVSKASTESPDRSNAMRALMHLVNDDRNKVNMCNTVVLHALVAGAAYIEDEDSHESAIRALERLATETTNRPKMARHPGLLQAVATAVEREVKLEDSKVASEHGYLAKPLLMTLLLAM